MRKTIWIPRRSLKIPTIGEPIARGRVKPTTALKAWPVAFSSAGILSLMYTARQ
jgi:hypothetical protein